MGKAINNRHVTKHAHARGISQRNGKRIMSAAFSAEVPTHSHPNSRDAADRALSAVGIRRKQLAEDILNNPNALSCYDWCEGALNTGWGHGAVSGTLSTMKKHELIPPAGTKKNGRGNNETTWKLNPYVQRWFHHINWNQTIEGVRGQIIKFISESILR